MLMTGKTWQFSCDGTSIASRGKTIKIFIYMMAAMNRKHIYIVAFSDVNFVFYILICMKIFLPALFTFDLIRVKTN